VLNRIPPCQPNEFADRERLRQEILDFATSGGPGEPRIAVLTGPPGIGKTALALRTAHDLAEPDIRLYAKLDTDPEAPGNASEALAELLLDLGMDRAAVPDRLSARAGAFRALTNSRSVLLLIDGASTAAQVRALLPGDGVVLVTEARPLSPIAARSFALPPLDADAAGILLARFADAEPELVEKIIELAAGLPLALRVAGALLARPDRPTFAANDILTTAYDVLDGPARCCYRALALPGTTAEIGLAALAAALPTVDVRAAMTDLVAAHLADEPADGRFRTNELIRQHARTVEPPDPLATISLREHYLARTAAAYRDTNRWPQAEPWFACPPGTDTVDLAWLDAERGNIRAALEHAFACGERELVATWCVLLWPYYEHGKQVADLLATHQLGLRTANEALRCLLLTRFGFGQLFAGDTEAAIATCAQAVESATEPRLEATALEGLGLALLADEQDDRARPALRRNLELARQLAEPRRLALACLHDAKVEQPAIALPLLDAAEPIFADDPVNLAKTHLWRGRKLTERGDLADAREALDLALTGLTALRRPFDRAEVLAARGELNLAAGQLEPARADRAQARAVFEEWGFSRRAARLPR
jgi:tetratricopeptide (TPR) repeat protein